MIYDASASVGRHASFVQALMPVLGRWLIFVICLPIAGRGWASLKARDWHGLAVALLILLCFAMLFACMMVLFWEVIKYMLGI